MNAESARAEILSRHTGTFTTHDLPVPVERVAREPESVPERPHEPTPTPPGEDRAERRKRMARERAARSRERKKERADALRAEHAHEEERADVERDVDEQRASAEPAPIPRRSTSGDGRILRVGHRDGPSYSEWLQQEVEPIEKAVCVITPAGSTLNFFLSDALAGDVARVSALCIEDGCTEDDRDLRARLASLRPGALLDLR
jgi:hypothetical protein